MSSASWINLAARRRFLPRLRRAVDSLLRSGGETPTTTTTKATDHGSEDTHGDESADNSSGEHESEGNETESETLKLDPSFTRFTLIITISLTALFVVIIAFIYGCNKDRLTDIGQKLRKLVDLVNSKLRF